MRQVWNVHRNIPFMYECECSSRCLPLYWLVVVHSEYCRRPFEMPHHFYLSYLLSECEIVHLFTMPNEWVSERVSFDYGIINRFPLFFSIYNLPLPFIPPYIYMLYDEVFTFSSSSQKYGILSLLTRSHTCIAHCTH